MSTFRIAGFAGLLLVAALVGGTVIGTVAAATSPRTASSAVGADPVDAAPPPAAGTAGDYCADFRRAFAANLGVDASALTPAAKAAAIATIDAAVSDGRMSKAIADRLKSRIEKADGDGCAFLAGRLARAAAVAGVAKDGLIAAADALDMTPAELRAALRSGKSLKDVAVAEGVPYETVSAAIIAAVKGDLDAAVAAGRIRQERADRILDRLERNLADGRLRDARPSARSGPTSSPPPAPTLGS